MKYRFVWVGVAVFSVGVIWIINSFGIFSGPQQRFEDIVTPVRGVSSNVVIVAIDDESISRIGQWPWARSVFATTLSRLSASAPASVAIDVLFAEQSRFGASDDILFQQSVNTVSYPVVLPVQVQRLSSDKSSGVTGSGIVSSGAIVSANSTIPLGHVNLIVDRDGVVRQFPARVAVSGTTYVSLAQQAVTASRVSTPSFTPHSIEPIVFSGVSGAVPRIPFYRLYEGDPSALSAVSGKIVFIGATAPSLHDAQQVPVGSGIAMPGVEIQANIASMILSGYRQQNVPDFYMFLILVALGLVSFFIAFFFDLLPAVLVFLSLLSTEIIAFILLAQRGIFYSVLQAVIVSFGIFLAVKGYKYVTVDRRGRQVKKVFAKYVSPKVLDAILKNPESVKLGGEEREMTVFFSDIRGFTTISEKTTPTELVRILNEYFTAMTSEVLRTGGVVDKYIGDAIMAFWGAPIDDADHADHAMDAALTMIEKLKVLNEKLKAQGDPQIRIGIGLYSGKAVVGNVGSNDRFDYTVIGDTVNAASRLEGLNKEYKTQIIISETVKAQLKKEYPLICLGSAKVKGRAEPINIYTVEGMALPPEDDGGDTHTHH